jgi:hypothetical protein
MVCEMHTAHHNYSLQLLCKIEAMRIPKVAINDLDDPSFSIVSFIRTSKRAGNDKTLISRLIIAFIKSATLSRINVHL